MPMSLTNPGAPRLYHELDQTTYTHTQVGNNVWEDWDLSAIAGAYAFDIQAGGGGSTHGVRQNGSAMTRQNTSFSPTFRVLPDALGIVETFDVTGQVFRVMGYWT